MSFQKVCHRANHDNKVAQFYPKLFPVQQRIFSESANMANIQLSHHIMTECFESPEK